MTTEQNQDIALHIVKHTVFMTLFLNPIATVIRNIVADGAKFGLTDAAHLIILSFFAGMWAGVSMFDLNKVWPWRGGVLPLLLRLLVVGIPVLPGLLLIYFAAT